ncbi:hypothetical protein HY256_11415 [Candidatus Sumerlaeota bacterium]|nr:hypothetical protein [Candidatus Sumerlaeota bacterium]
MATTPFADVPDWLYDLFPALKRLEANPLYIRLSGQGLGPKRNRFLGRLPQEIALLRGPMHWRVGYLPAVLIGFPLLLAWQGGMLDFFIGMFAELIGQMFSDPRGWGNTTRLSAWSLSLFSFWTGLALLCSRAFVGQGGMVIRNFVRRGVTEPWGEALYMSPLSPMEYGHAFFAGLLQREFRSHVLWTMLIGLAMLATAFFSLFSTGSSGHPIEVALTIFAMLTVTGCAVLIELFFLSALNIGNGLLKAELSTYANRGFAVEIIQTFHAGMIFVLAHLPGLVVFSIFSLLSVLFLNFGSAPLVFGLGFTLGLFAFVLPNAALGISITRDYLESCEKSVGEAFAFRFRYD